MGANCKMTSDINWRTESVVIDGDKDYDKVDDYDNDVLF